MNPTSKRLASGVVSLALGCGAHISLFLISASTINVIHLAFSYLCICVVLLINTVVYIAFGVYRATIFLFDI